MNLKEELTNMKDQPRVLFIYFSSCLRVYGSVLEPLNYPWWFRSRSKKTTTTTTKTLKININYDCYCCYCSRSWKEKMKKKKSFGVGLKTAKKHQTTTTRLDSLDCLKKEKTTRPWLHHQTVITPGWSYSFFFSLSLSLLKFYLKTEKYFFFQRPEAHHEPSV